jgi:hypothetical protein
LRELLLLKKKKEETGVVPKNAERAELPPVFDREAALLRQWCELHLGADRETTQRGGLERFLGPSNPEVPPSARNLAGGPLESFRAKLPVFADGARIRELICKHRACVVCRGHWIR